MRRPITSGQEFDVGVVSEDERTVQELEGTKVINATIVRSYDLEK
jgi:hypothetical protein